MNKINLLAVILSATLAGTAFAKDEMPHVMAKSQLDAGKYLVMVGGCMDCHTPGWIMMPGKIPEAAWLTGWDVGWYGPWGTSYGKNLRVSVAKYPVEDWIKLIKGGTLRPPMPAETLKMTMSDEDFRAIYAYIKSLGAVGKDVPEALPPGIEPKGPWINMMINNITPEMKAMMEQPHGAPPGH